MKYTKLMACILVLALLWAGFAGCKYKLVLVPVDGESETETETQTEPVTEPPTTEEPTTEDPVAAAGIIEDNSFREAAMDKAGVLALYTQTVNDVKKRCPGYTKTVVLSTETAADGTKPGISERIMNLVVSALLNADGGSMEETVPPHSDIRVLEGFPVCGREYGCELTNLNMIDTAACYTDGEVYRLVITVHAVINPDAEDGEFYKIMTPIKRESVAEGFGALFSMSDLSDYLFDFNYRDNEIECVIDRETGRIISLSQRNVISVDMSVGSGLFFLQNIEAHGTVLHKLEFTDFVWD